GRRERSFGGTLRSPHSARRAGRDRFEHDADRVRRRRRRRRLRPHVPRRRAAGRRLRHPRLLLRAGQARGLPRGRAHARPRGPHRRAAVSLEVGAGARVRDAAHTRSEIEVGAALAERFDGATGRIILATFASHIHRIQQVLTLAAARGRQVALLGRSMEKNVAIASDLGYLGVPSGLLRTLEEVVALPAERQVILSTGSQGEPHSALALMAAGEHKYVQIARGDLVVISARVIPGNERTVGRVINALYRLGAEVLYEDNAFVHVSGHASQEDLKLMLKLTQPRYFVPVHGEYRHLL